MAQRPASPSSLSGIFAAAITPRRRSGDEIDVAAALEIIDFLGRSGVQGIMLLGATGEFPHFSLTERTRLAGLAIKRSRVPVLVNASHSTLDGAVRLGQEAIDQGAAGLLILPPTVYSYSAPDLEQFFRRFAREVGKSVPLLLYNLPSVAGPIPLSTALRLLSTGRYMGIKDSSGQASMLHGLQALLSRKPFTLLIGNDALFTQGRMAGAQGGISGVACALPELLLSLHAAIQKQDAPRRDRLQSRLQEFLYWLDRFPAPVGVREAVAARGLAVGPHAVPFSRDTQTQVQAFRLWLKDWLPGMLRDCE